MSNQLFFEATIAPADDAKSGREWEVVIIGAKTPADVVTVEGEEYVQSLNGRLYSVRALAESVPMWDGVKVYDDHLTQAEFEARQGMRSPVREWLGTIVQPVWDATKRQLKGVFKVVEDRLAAKLKSAHEQGVLNSIGLSIDTFPIIERQATIEGVAMPIIDGFQKVLSVDLVGDPAAGGGFGRLIAANITHEELNMDNQQQEAVAEVEETAAEAKPLTADEIKQLVVSTIAEALAADEDTDDTVQEAEEVETVETTVEAEADTADDVQESIREARAARREAQLARCELQLERKLADAKLPPKFEEAVRGQFGGRLFEMKELEKMVKSMKEAAAAVDPTGRVSGAGQQRRVEVGLGPEDKFAVEMARLMMGNSAFRSLESDSGDAAVADNLRQFESYKAWVNNGRPSLGNYPRMSSLLYAHFDGNPVLDSRAYEAATTSTLATVVKNVMNIMVAADYSKRERWYEPLVVTEEVDTIDDATLARVYGVSNLSVVDEGAAYTELPLVDEEETASFVKKGNYVAITMETLMRDKINYVRRIPRALSNAWYNTLSELVANVFTVNTAAGPVLSDTGALFNATAATTAGGHANLLTTALSFAAFSAARTAMRKQTDQPLGVGRKLQITPAFLLVPEDLETTAIQIRDSELQPNADGAGTTGNQTVNPFRGKFEVVVVPDWSDTNNWALMGDPQMYPAIYNIFPRGQRTPQLFTADNEVAGSMFTNDTLRYKVRMLTYRFSSTYDCAPVADFRPLHKSNVA